MSRGEAFALVAAVAILAFSVGRNFGPAPTVQLSPEAEAWIAGECGAERTAMCASASGDFYDDRDGDPGARWGRF